MSRYKPANGMIRCPICRELIPAEHGVRGPHFWNNHGLFGAMAWRWRNNEPGDRLVVVAFWATVAFGIAAIVFPALRG